MTQIVLTSEQIAELAKAKGPVVLVDSKGTEVGRIAGSHFSAYELAAARARIGKDGPYLTTAELLQKLETLRPVGITSAAVPPSTAR